MTDIIEVKTAELEGAALDWAVAKAIGHETSYLDCIISRDGSGIMPYSTAWRCGGPLIERERISLSGPGCMGGFKERLWSASIDTGSYAGGRAYSGPEPLIAACRCLVGLELGETVQVPKELMS